MRRPRAFTICIGALAAAFVSTVHAQQPTRSVNDGVYAADQAKRGEALYAGACASCHVLKDPADRVASPAGATGPALAGNGFIAAWKEKTVSDLFAAVGAGPAHAAPLAPEQTADVVSFLLSANQFPPGAAALTADGTVLTDIHLAEPAAAGPAAAAVPAPADTGGAGGAAGGGLYGTVQVQRGQAVFKEICVMCHGSTLRGGVGPALAGPRFVARWNDKGVADVFEKIKTTMPQSAPGTLTPEQVADVVAFILSSNHYPGGEIELTADAAPLKTAPLGEPPQK